MPYKEYKEQNRIVRFPKITNLRGGTPATGQSHLYLQVMFLLRSRRSTLVNEITNRYTNFTFHTHKKLVMRDQRYWFVFYKRECKGHENEDI